MDTLLNRLSTRAKVMGNAIILVLLLVLTSSTALVSMGQVGDELEAIAHQDIPLTEKITLITEHQLEQAIHFERGLRYGTLLLVNQASDNRASQQSLYQQEKQSFDLLSVQVEQEIKQAQSFANSAANNGRSEKDKQAFQHIQQQLQVIESEHRSFERHAVEVFDLLEQGKLMQSERLAEQVGQEEDQLDLHLAELLKEIEAFTHQATERALAHEQDAISLQATIMLLAAVFGLATSALISRNVVRRLSMTVQDMNQVAKGDLSRDVTSDGSDEIGQLQRAMAKMRQNLLGMVRQISQITHQLTVASEEVAMAMSQSSNNVQNQQAQTDAFATAMNQMSATVHDVATNVAQSSDSAHQADLQTRQGHRLMSHAIDELSTLAKQMESSSQLVTQLGENSETVGSVLEVIRSIADQTNLLALNAAIEAARAGESGRGFSVVADEVRVLATRTQESTEEIQDIIEQLQTGASQVVEAMSASREQTDTVVEHAQKAEKSLNDIANSVARINEMTSQISTATDEQNQVVEDMTRSVVQINEMAHQNASSIEETAQAGTDLSRMSHELGQLVARFKL